MRDSGGGRRPSPELQYGALAKPQALSQKVSTPSQCTEPTSRNLFGSRIHPWWRTVDYAGRRSIKLPSSVQPATFPQSWKRSERMGDSVLLAPADAECCFRELISLTVPNRLPRPYTVPFSRCSQTSFLATRVLRKRSLLYAYICSVKDNSSNHAALDVNNVTNSSLLSPARHHLASHGKRSS